MKIGDLIHDHEVGLSGIICNTEPPVAGRIEDPTDMMWVILYEDGCVGRQLERALEAISAAV